MRVLTPSGPSDRAVQHGFQVDDSIRISGARQNNLRNLDLELPLGTFTVITGVSGSGKSSLAFDTIYAEGQRRYVETFSPYARQFLDRMDRPQVDAIYGIPPAIAIEQSGSVRTSRSTVGTMTELNDYLKLLFARAATLHCSGCDQPVTVDTPMSVAARLLDDPGLLETMAIIVFRVEALPGMDAVKMRALLEAQGYTRIEESEQGLLVQQDRLRLREDNRSRLQESLETAFRLGRGRLVVRTDADGEERHFSDSLHCANCDIAYAKLPAAAFSFNSPLGACPQCRGFGRTIGVDYRLVIPDPTRTLRDGAIKPWQTGAWHECQQDLERYARRRGVALDVPWNALPAADREWIIEGEGGFEDGVWYGIKRFFEYLETKSYKMHIRVLLSKYRDYETCSSCHGARLKPEALNWRLHGVAEGGDHGLDYHAFVLLPVTRTLEFIDALQVPGGLGEALALVLGEIRSRLRFLIEVGVGYLTLDRQSRTLSGGEVQRINLTTALGSSLVNTLFVLDEPSIGLHSRDVARIVEVLKRLRDAGNTLLVVEHDPQLMLAADRLIDMGPGPGRAGGAIVYHGPAAGIASVSDSLTAAFLRGERRISRERRPVDARQGPRLELLGVSAHNLRDVDVRIPLGALVCVTGVSGSGKSTLVGDVLYLAARQHFGRPLDAPGPYRALHGLEQLADVVFVDQAPIARSARSNPASHVGAWTAIRNLFARTELARERDYNPGTFSFNSGDGRCPVCAGSGFEHVEMQFLSDVYLRCPECDGRRFRGEVLEVRLAGGQSIACVLELSVDEAMRVFADEAEVVRALTPLVEVGLGYLALGQPVPTLSGGESQRLKLAGHIAEAASRRRAGKGVLFVFDEPTTGLHFDDIARLLGAFDRLLEGGDSLLVIEHNLDVIECADWLLELGPDGGEAGGELLFCGTPDAIVQSTCPTGVALAAWRDERGRLPAPVRVAARSTSRPLIEIRHAREHNLKDIDLELPRDALSVITGISGSGKSTLAFDILFAEGQRRYLESLNAYARQFVQPAVRPDVDAIRGIPPAVAVEQRTSRGGRKSTVATMTEIHHYLRLLFVKLGLQYCPDCDIPIEAQSPELIAARILREFRGRRVQLLAPLVRGRKGLYTAIAASAARRGQRWLRVDGAMLATESWPRLDRYREHWIELPVAEVEVRARNEPALRTALDEALAAGAGSVQVLVLDGGPQQGSTTAYSTRRSCPRCERSFAELDPRLFSYNSAHGWCPSCFGTGLQLEGFDAEQSGEEHVWTDWWQGQERPCPDCAGQRLRPEALAVRMCGHGPAFYNAMTVDAATVFFERLRLDGREAEIARDVLPELRSRLGFLREVGLGYLTLERSAPTLSGGEAQRIRLAAQLGSNLRGVCYILDEPTIGLHPRDNAMLLRTLEQLRAKGNTVVVVEHDEETMRRADYIVDLGPGAGRLGGEVVAVGDIDAVMRSPHSVTARFLREPLRHPLRGSRRAVATATPRLEIRAAQLHNLRGIDVAVPLERLVCLSGVSGSGKSTLMREVLESNLRAQISRQRRARVAWQHCETMDGWQAITRVFEVDQTPIGKTPRSCPATYIGVWDAVRKLFAATPQARVRGFSPGRFSFNTGDGRCGTCEGHGQQRIEMNFLPEVHVVCEECGGARFNTETLEVRFRDHSISDVLDMSVSEAVEFFAAHPSIRRPLALLDEVGLGYLRLGQPSPTLSGGEAQRIKLVAELARMPAESRRGNHVHALYLLDEPTVGLHMADVEKLVGVLHRLVDAGNSVLLIEHNLDVLAEADWIIDLGPEGGARGGRVVVSGTPERVARSRRSHTGRVLADFLAERGTLGRRGGAGR